MAEVKYGFRILNCSSEQLEALKNVMGKQEYWTQPVLESEKINFGFDIEEENDYTNFFNVLRPLDINATEYGLFLSMTMFQDHDGLSFPQYILDFHRKAGGQIDISLVFYDSDLES